MKAVDFYFWIIPQPAPKKPRISRWRMTMEDGQRQFPRGKPDLSTKETRQLPDTEDEHRFLGHSVKSGPPKVG